MNTLLKIYVVCILLCPSLTDAQTKYHLYHTSIECTLEKKEMISKAHSTLVSTLDALVTEGNLVNHEDDIKIGKDKITLGYTLPAENEVQYKIILETWSNKLTGTEVMTDIQSACRNRKDTLLNNYLMMYPQIHHPGSGVVDVSTIDVKPESSLNYKIVYDFISFTELKNGKKGKIDSASVNWGLPEIGRWINLHLVSGIPKNKIQIVVAIHANAMESFFNNVAYQKKYKINNPNLSIINELNKAGVSFLICGQSLTWRGFNKEMLLPSVKLSLTAQTILSSYQMKGYAFKSMSNR